MPLDIREVEVVDGSTIANQDRVVMGLLAGIPNLSSPGAIASVAVNTSGAYGSLPVIGTSGNGSSASLVARMKVVAAAVAAAGSGYAPGDTITFTGGTASQQGIMTINTSKLVGVAVNAAGTGYA